MERKKSYVANTAEGIRRAQEGNFAFIGEAVSLDLAVARYCDLIRAQEVISMRSYSIAAPLGGSMKIFHLWRLNLLSLLSKVHCHQHVFCY